MSVDRLFEIRYPDKDDIPKVGDKCIDHTNNDKEVTVTSLANNMVIVEENKSLTGERYALDPQWFVKLPNPKAIHIHEGDNIDKFVAGLRVQIKDLTAVTVKCGNTIAELRSQVEHLHAINQSQATLLIKHKRHEHLRGEFDDLIGFCIDDWVENYVDCVHEDGDKEAGAEIKEYIIDVLGECDAVTWEKMIATEVASRVPY